MRFFKKDGKKEVTKAIGLFHKLIKKLQNSIALCMSEMDKKSEEISELTCEREEITESLQQAKRVLTRLEDFIK